jgi:hypothetical protein
MNRTKNLLIGLVTVVGMPAFADTKTTTSSSDENRLEALFKADLQYRSESESEAVVVAVGREGVYIGSGDGTAIGDRLRGTVRWSLWSGNAFIPWYGAANQCLRSPPLHYQSRGVHRNPGRSSNPIRWQRLWPSQLRKVPNEPHTNLQH